MTKTKDDALNIIRPGKFQDINGSVDKYGHPTSPAQQPVKDEPSRPLKPVKVKK